jgi:6-phosphogluconate dehydrogenase
MQLIAEASNVLERDVGRIEAEITDAFLTKNKSVLASLTLFMEITANIRKY